MKQFKTILMMVCALSWLSQVDAQILNDNASWPNGAWALNGTFVAGAVDADPTVSPNFSYDDDAAGSGSTDSISVESPVIDITAAVTGGETWLTVDLVTYNYNFGDIFDIEYWDADASDWVAWASIPDNSGTTSNFCAAPGAPPSFQTGILDVGGFTPTQQSGFRYRLYYDATAVFGWGVCTDSPVLQSQAPPTCPDPGVPTASNISDSDADISWTAGDTETEWDLYYGATPLAAPDEFTVPTAPNVTVNLNYDLNGLAATTEYAFYVRADCAPGDSSDWVGPLTFTTACPAFGLPYTEDFEGTGLTNGSNYTDICWSTVDNGAYDWEISIGGSGTGSTGTGPAVGSNGDDFVFAESSSGSNGDVAELITPLLDLPLGSAPLFSFDYHMFGATVNQLDVDINDGSGWVNLTTIVGEQQTSEGAAWITEGLDLCAYAGSLVNLRFAATRGTSFTGDIAIDNVSVQDFTCPSVLSVTADNISDTGADITWDVGTAPACASGITYEVDVLVAGSSIGGAYPQSGVAGTSTTLSGLSISTNYEVVITPECVGGTANNVFFWTLNCAPASQCSYTLELFDYGNGLVGGSDGWPADGLLTVTTGNQVSTYTIEPGVYDPPFSDGAANNPDAGFTFNIDACPGDVFEVFYSGTNGDEEDVWRLSGPSGFVFDGATIDGEGLSTAACPTCPSVLSATASNICEDGVDLDWTNGSPYDSVHVRLAYGPTLPFLEYSADTLIAVSDAESLSWTNIDFQRTNGTPGTPGTPETIRVTITGYCTPAMIGDPVELSVFNTTYDTPDCICDEQCSYTVTVTDDFGDGWGSSFVDVLIDGSSVGTVTAVGFGPNVLTVSTCPGSLITFDLVDSDSFDAEYGITIDGSIEGNLYTLNPGDFSNFTSTSQTLVSTTTCPDCIAPTDFAAINVAADSARIVWTENTGNFNFDYGLAVDTLGAAAPTWFTTTDTTALFTGLSPLTPYTAFVADSCALGASDTLQVNFTTGCPIFVPPYEDGFETYVQQCWDEGDNGASTDPSGGPATTGAGEWSASSAIGGDAAARINLWNLGSNDWILTPEFDLTGGGFEVSLDVAVAAFSGGGVIDMGSDDIVDVLYTEDGITWTSVGDFTETDGIGNTYETFTFSVPSSASNVQFGIFASEGVADDAEDYYFYVSRFQIRLTPTCPEPTALNISNVTDATADFGWTANGGEIQWDVYITGAGDPAPDDTVGSFPDVLTNPYMFSGLEPDSAYDAYVRADCIPLVDSSIWAGPVSFTTAPFCEAPSAAFLDDVTATSFTVAWNPTPNNGTGYYVEVADTTGYAGFGTGDVTANHPDTFFTASSLSAETTYFFILASNCGAEGSDTLQFLVTTRKLPPTGPAGVTCSTSGALPAVVYTEEFAAGNPNGWTGTLGGGNNTWDFGTSGGSNSTGTGPAVSFSAGNHLEFEASSTAPPSGSAEAISPVIDLTAFVDAAELSFYMHAFGVEDEFGQLDVAVSADAGVNWDTVFTWVGAYQLTDVEDWVQVGADISAYVGQTIQVRFSQTDGASGFLGDMSIDLLEISACGLGCLEPSGLTATGINGSGADLGWAVNGLESTWDLQIQEAIDGPPADADPGNYPDVMVNPYPYVDGMPETDYEFYVRADCGAADTSDWVGPFPFTTPCAIVTPDYEENFDTFPPNCWDQADNGASTDPSAGPATTGTSEWGGSSALGGEPGVRINLWNLGSNEWILGRNFDLSGGSYVLNLDVGIAAFGGGGPSDMGSDDSVQILYSEDAGASWNVLASITDADNLPNSYTTLTYPITSTGADVQFAIFATEGSVDDAEDYYFYISRFEIGAPPTCPNPTGLSASYQQGPDGIDFQWTGGNQFEGALVEPATIYWGTQGFTIGGAGQIGSVPVGSDAGPNSVFLSGTLAGSTDYQVCIVEDCEILGPGEGQSDTVCVSFSTPIFNDDCVDATTIACGTITNGTTVGAAPSTVGDDGGTPLYTGDNESAPDVWYTFVGVNSDDPLALLGTPGDQVTLSTCNDGGATGGTAAYDSKIDVYTSCTPTTLAEYVGGNDDGTGCAGFSSLFSFPTTVGTTYYVRMYGFGAFSTGTFELEMTCEAPCLPVPLNDNCSSPEVLGLEDFGTGAYTFGTNACASGDANPSCDPFGTIQGVWYEFTTDASGEVFITLDTIGTGGIGADVIHYALYDVAPCDGVASQLACSDPESAAGISDLFFSLAPSTAHKLLVWTNENEFGSHRVRVTGPPPPPANDDCAGAVVLPVGTGNSCSAGTAGTLLSATQSPEATSPQCFQGTPPTDVWYKLEIPASGKILIDFPTTPAGAMFSELFTGENVGGTCTLTYLDQSCNGVHPKAYPSRGVTVANALTPGDTVYVRVWEPGNDNLGSFEICVTDPRPTNDECADAVSVPTNEFGTGGWTQGRSDYAYGEGSSCGNGEETVFYSFVATDANQYIVARPLGGGDYDAVIEVFDACGGTSLGCFDNYAGGIERAMATGLTEGNTYYYSVSHAGAPGSATSDDFETGVRRFSDGSLDPDYCGILDYTLDEAVYASRDDLGELYVNPNVAVRAYGFRFQETSDGTTPNGNLDVSIQQPDLIPYIQLDDVAGLEYGKQYLVSTQHKIRIPANGVGVPASEFWSDFQAPCLIGLQADVPSTQLTAAFCNGGDYYLEQQIQADPVLGATEYRFTFTGPGGPFVETSSNYAIFLYNVGPFNGAGLQYNSAVYTVSVEAFVNGAYSPILSTCTISMESQPENTEVAQGCGETFNYPNDPNFILAEYVYGATGYEWEFSPASGQTGGTQTTTTAGISLAFHITDLDLSEGGDWDVRVRALAEGQNGAFSTTCTITINATGAMAPPSDDTAAIKLNASTSAQADIYPNPSNGEQIAINLTDLSDENQVIVLEVIDFTGKVVHTEQLANKGSNANFIVDFNNRLAKGMYFVNLYVNDEMLVEKLTVE